jgi:hypothetical protein
MLGGLDFTLGKYANLCRVIVDSVYRPVTMAEYLEKSGKSGDRTLILRHDIDRSPQRALEVARLESEYHLRSTYYFRIPATFKPAFIDEISSLGHEIGFHYETLDKSRGNMLEAARLFGQELTRFRAKYQIRTVCAHGNPLTKNDNKEIWKSLRFSDFGLLGEAFLSLDFDWFAYFSDSGRTWLNNKSQKMPGKDSVQTAYDHYQPKSTDDVIDIVRQGAIPNICILTHPERWSKDIAAFTSRFLLDLAFSWGKAVIYASGWGARE